MSLPPPSGLAGGIGHFCASQIVDRVPRSPVTAIRPKPPHGVEYEVRIDIDSLNGETHPIVTGWLVDGVGVPRLLTSYVELRRLA